MQPFPSNEKQIRNMWAISNFNTNKGTDWQEHQEHGIVCNLKRNYLKKNPSGLKRLNNFRRNPYISQQYLGKLDLAKATVFPLQIRFNLKRLLKHHTNIYIHTYTRLILNE